MSFVDGLFSTIAQVAPIKVKKIDVPNIPKILCKRIEATKLPATNTVDIGNFAVLQPPKLSSHDLSFSQCGIYYCSSERDVPNEEAIINLPITKEAIIERAYWDYIFESVLSKSGQNPDKQKEFSLLNRLYPYQLTGVNFLMNNDFALLADEMGLGKSVMTAVAMKLLIRRGIRKRALIVCPVSVLAVWEKHMQDWADELVTLMVRGDQAQRRKLWKTPAHVYITAYTSLRIDIKSGILSQKRLEMFDLIALDEAHKIKSFEAQVSQYIKKLVADQKWAITGTPIQNKVDELISLFSFLKKNYLTRAEKNDLEVIKKKIRPYTLRRRKDVELAGKLPEKLPSIEEWLELGPNQRQEYEEVLGTSQAELRRLGDNVTYTHIFAQITALKQVCNCTFDLSESIKLEKLVEQVEEIIENGHKVIVFSQYIQRGVDIIIPALAKFGVCKIVGGMTDEERKEQSAMLSRPDINVMVASLRAAGEGLTLTDANYVIHFDLFWNPASAAQASDRVHRIGQMKTVTIYEYWIKDSIEERIHELLVEKGLLFDEVINNLADKSATKLISKSEWLKVFGIKR